MINLIKNPFERKQKGAVPALFIVFMLWVTCFLFMQRKTSFGRSESD